jgi:muconate cycloisomerase
MKITKIEAIPLNIPIGHHRMLGAGALCKIENIIVKLYTDEGVIGLGEASPWEVFGENSKCVFTILNNYLIPAVIGMDPFAIEKIMYKMDKLLVGGTFAKAAIEMALFDIIGKSLQQPLYNLLGGLFREGVKMSYSVSSQDLNTELKEISMHIEKGVNIFKVKTGVKNHSEDMERLNQIKKLLGDSAELRIDYNQAIVKENATKYCRQLEEFNPIFIEQPVSSWDIDGLAKITKAIGTPIVADESAFSYQDAMRIAKKEAADIISIKLMKSGGIRNALKIAAVAESANIPCYSGLMWESSVGLSAALHLALATKNISYGGDYYIPYFLMENDIVINPHEFKNGEVRPNHKPGLGVELDDKAVEKFRIN